MTSRRIPAPKWSPELSRWTYPTFNMKGALVWLTIPGDDTPPPASVAAKPYKGKILPTANETWGFWGTISNAEGDRFLPQEAWNVAFQVVAATFALSPELTRDFLDSRTGRHLADELTNLRGDKVGARQIRTELVQLFSTVGWHRTALATIEEIREG